MGLVQEIWIDKGKGLVKPEAFSELAKSKAEEVFRHARGNTNNTSQLRKFYDTIFNLNQRAKTVPDENDSAWLSIMAQLHRQIAMVHYAKGRKLVSENFVNMLEELIKAVKTKKDLQVVTDFFEAFMAFYKELKPN